MEDPMWAGCWVHEPLLRDDSALCVLHALPEQLQPLLLQLQVHLLTSSHVWL